MNKVRVYHFLAGNTGGVFSVVSNLLKYSASTLIENHVIYTINKEITPVFVPGQLEGAVTEKIFYYSPKWNFYFTCRQLASFIPDDKAILIAHDWLELGMAGNLGLQNPVVQVLHGDFDYYYDLSAKHGDTVDAFICISPKIFQSLNRKLSSRKDDIYYLNFPVPDVATSRKQHHSIHLIYYVRDLQDDRKQFSTIIEIARQLESREKKYFFTIAGGGTTHDDFFKIWPAEMKSQVNYVGVKTNQEIIAMLPGQDIFLLPSLSEGFPVSLVEAMKAGVVPLITDWDGAVDDLVSPGITGYYFKTGASAEYAACIKMLDENRILLQQLSGNCIQRANSLFNPVRNTKKFEDLFVKVSEERIRTKQPGKAYGSRLDEKWIPNWVTNTIRIFSK